MHAAGINRVIKTVFKNAGLLLVFAASIALSSLAHAIPDVQHWETRNGARVMFVPVEGLPMVDIRIVFDAGSARDAGKSGLSTLTNGLLAEGAGGLSSQQIAEQFESVGAEFSNAALRDMAYVSVRSLTDKKYLEPAIDTLTTVLTRADFPADAYARELARMKVAAVARKQSPSDIADEAFYRAIYGDHPYAEPSAGTEASLQQLSPEAVRGFYQQYYVAKNAVISIVGEVDRAQAEALTERLVSGLNSGQRAADLPEVKMLSKAREIRIEYPSRQSHIFVGQPGMKRTDEHYLALYVANHAFGGSGFTSRLVDSIREERGLAYSVYSYFSPMRELGPFMMGMQTRSDQTAESLELLREELERYLEEGPSTDEIKASINNITGSFPLNLDSNSKLLDYIAMIGFYDLPLDYLHNFIQRVEAIDANAAKTAMQQRIRADRLVTVVVGSDASHKADSNSAEQ